MKQNLSENQIKFIDNYLYKSGVLYTDIRMEMVDHVASEIEKLKTNGDTREFYYIFKDFMVDHKASLIKSSRHFYKASDKRILIKLYQKSISFGGIAILLAVYFGFRALEKFVEPSQFELILKFSPLAILIPGVLIYVFLTRINKERFSSLERIGLYFSVVFQIVYYFINLISKFELSNKIFWEIGASLIIFVMINLILISIEIRKEYQRDYNTVF